MRKTIEKRIGSGLSQSEAQVGNQIQALRENRALRRVEWFHFQGRRETGKVLVRKMEEGPLGQGVRDGKVAGA
jgi:hypothetical protein